MNARDFFQPGHTYTDSEHAQYDWRFRCDTVTTHPENGERTALGWRFFCGRWEPYAYGEDGWEVNQAIGYVDVTEGKSSPSGADATPDFFRAGRTYRSRCHADLRFECLALSTDPETEQMQAIGWRFGPPRNGVRPYRLADLGIEDWACCDWAETTGRGEAR